MIQREQHLQNIIRGLEQFPVVALLGPRQVGKTTLARQLATEWPGPHHHVDLEDPDDLARLSDPSFALRPLTGLVVLDEIQTQPQLFPLLLGHYHAQTWNGSELSRALGVSDKTVSRYLDILEGSFMAWRLRPWHAKLGKREVKAPRVYLSDTGLLHSLLGITDANNLLSHPKCGASWEGFALSEVIRHTPAQRDECYFWALHSGAELDFLLVRGGQRLGFDVKLTRSPKVTASMRTAQQALALSHLYVLCHAPDQAAPWPLAEGITAVPLHTLASALPPC